MSVDKRICILSQRNLQRLVSRSVDYEFEDIISDIDDADIIAPRPGRFFEVRHKIGNQLARHCCLTSVNSGIKKTYLTKDYDLFFAVCMFPRDLLFINTLRGIKDHCRKSVCWLDEVWANELHLWKGHLKILSRFDYVILNCSASAKPIQEAINKPCIYLPPGVDAVKFSPYPELPRRCVDVYNLGRRSHVMHEALLAMAEQSKIFYIYDTLQTLHTLHHRQHRSLISNIAKRSRYFIASAAKFNRPFETYGQNEIGFRFFEGAASGAVMIGEPPANEAFKEHFGWPDAIIQVPYDFAEIPDVLNELNNQPERLEKIHKNNVMHSLLKHDWAYRWKEILEIVGLESTPALNSRLEHLRNLSDEIKRTL